jgi:hypothetical protein
MGAEQFSQISVDNTMSSLQHYSGFEYLIKLCFEVATISNCLCDKNFSSVVTLQSIKPRCMN